MAERRVGWAGVVVLARGPEEVLAHLFGRVEAPSAGEVAAVVELAGDAVLTDGWLVAAALDPGTAAEVLLAEVSHALVVPARGGMTLHAAAVGTDARAVLIGGVIEAGKSTLTAWLVHRGLAHHTDELVYVPEGATAIEPYRRPLNLRADVRDVLAPLLRPGPNLSWPGGDVRDPSCFGRAAAPTRPELAALLFPRFARGAALELRPLTRAEAAAQLLTVHVNARNLPGHGFGELVRIARAAPAWRLTYGALDQLAPVEATLREVL